MHDSRHADTELDRYGRLIEHDIHDLEQQIEFYLHTNPDVAYELQLRLDEILKEGESASRADHGPLVANPTSSVKRYLTNRTTSNQHRNRSIEERFKCQKHQSNS